MPSITCYHCHNTWQIEPMPSRSEECSSCHKDAKVCLNCRFYDTSAYRQCKEPQAEWVSHKDQGNFCGYFSPLVSSNLKEGKELLSEKQQTLNQLEQLFRK